MSYESKSFIYRYVDEHRLVERLQHLNKVIANRI